MHTFQSHSLVDGPRRRAPRPSEGPSRRLALPVPMFVRQQGAPRIAVASAIDPADEILSRLADALGSPEEDLLTKDLACDGLHRVALDRLGAIGAVSVYSTREDTELHCKINPAGIQWKLSTSIHSSVNDMDALAVGVFTATRQLIYRSWTFSSRCCTMAPSYKFD